MWYLYEYTNAFKCRLGHLYKCVARTFYSFKKYKISILKVSKRHLAEVSKTKHIYKFEDV